MKTVSKNSIFESRDYLSYLKTHFALSQKTHRGAKAEFAKAARCSTPYLSHILSGKAHLTPEQAWAAARVLNFSETERMYFFYLVLKDRSGTAELKSYFDQELNKIKREATNISKRLGLKDKVSPEVEATYYSQWYYSAIRVCLYLPGLRNVKTLAQQLKLDPETIIRVLNFLKNSGLIVDGKEGLQPTEKNPHLSEDSPSILKHHTHWRLKALQNLEQKKSEDIHYTSLISVSEKDLEKVREVLMQAVKDIRTIVGHSHPEEVVYCYSIDCFAIAKSS